MVLIRRSLVQLVLCQMLSGVNARNCGRQASVHGMMLQRHIFNIVVVSTSLECLMACNDDNICQSFNYVVSNNMCELNNRTKEARPEDFVPDSDRYYYGKVRNRVPLGSISGLPAESCKEIKASEGEQAVSGNYWFKSHLVKNTVLVHCDMKTEDIDECEHDIHDCLKESAICVNTIGSYNCVCKEGYYGDGNTICTPEECLNFKNLTSETRKSIYDTPMGNEHCDKNRLSPGWYRFQGDAGTKMPTTCVEMRKCGTAYTGWLKGGHPTVTDGKVKKEVCFHRQSCCKISTFIDVRNCGSFFVYNLVFPNSCDLGYCSTD